MVGGMGDVPIIDAPGELTPTWLTTALVEGGHLDGGVVVGVEVRPLGTGQMSRSLRVSLEYDGPSGGPSSLIAKLPADDEQTRTTAAAMRSYEKEVRFYQQLAGDLPVPTPTVFHADIDVAANRFVLLLADLAPAAQGDQLLGCDVADASAALEALAGLHAPRWGDPSLADLEWLHGDQETGRQMLAMLLPMLWGGFQERYAADLGPEVHQVGDVLFANIDHYLAPTDGPVTIVHGDYRLDNLLFDPADDAVRGVVDWQTCTVGPAMRDVAYFVGAGLAVGPRREAENALVGDYHDRLVTSGVAEYPLEQAWSDYRMGTFAGLVMAVAASMMVERTPRGDEMFLTMADRHTRHIQDHDALSILA